VADVGRPKPGVGAMPKGLRRVGRFLRERIGWQGLGFAVCLAIIVFAFVVLYFQLRDIVFGEVIDAFRNTPRHTLVLAGLFVTAGYVILTFYDYFALRTIGRRDVSYRTAALAGFTSYAIGHNVGFSAFSGGAVRYRIYASAAGLSLIEVAKICFIAGLTFWLGNVAVLGIGFVIDPAAASAIDRLPPTINRVIGAAGLAVLAGYVMWVSVKPRHVGRASWNVQLPGGGLTLLQIVIGVVDLACCAAAMYVLMPASPPIDFPTLAVIFVSATLLGFASHSPGGLGVFDAAMLVALTHFDKEDLLGALLLFRLFYYIVPFALALVLVGARELLIDFEWISEHMPSKPELVEPVGGTTVIEKSIDVGRAKSKGRRAKS
jgi:glycosyltransferase 2 family protein